MDLKENSNTDWCQDDFDPDDDDDINRPGPSGLKHNTGHFLVQTFLFLFIYFYVLKLELGHRL